MDGLTVPFYLTFWTVIGKYVHANILEAEQRGQFTVDDRRGILKLIPKKGKPPTLAKNLRPITLLNVDFKLLTRVLAMRVATVIPKIIDPDQRGFVQSRFLGENVIEVQTLITMAEQYNAETGDEFALFSLDIEKAFDSIDWSFMKSILEGFGFPPKIFEVHIGYTTQCTIENPQQWTSVGSNRSSSRSSTRG